jgi:hypothetical protein
VQTNTTQSFSNGHVRESSCAMKVRLFMLQNLQIETKITFAQFAKIVHYDKDFTKK